MKVCEKVCRDVYRKGVQQRVQASAQEGKAHLDAGAAAVPLLLLAPDQADLQRGPCLMRRGQGSWLGWAARVG